MAVSSVPGFISIPIRLPASEDEAYRLHRSGVESLGIRTGLARRPQCLLGELQIHPRRAAGLRDGPQGPVDLIECVCRHGSCRLVVSEPVEKDCEDCPSGLGVRLPE